MLKKKKNKHNKYIIKHIPKRFNKDINYNFLNTQNYVRWKENVAKSYILYMKNKLTKKNKLKQKEISIKKLNILFNNIKSFFRDKESLIYWLAVILLTSGIIIYWDFDIILSIYHLLFITLFWLALRLTIIYIYTYLFVDFYLLIIWFIVIYIWVIELRINSINNNMLVSIIIIPIFLLFLLILAPWLYLFILKPIIYKSKHLYNLASLYFKKYDKYFFIVRKPNTENPWEILFQSKNVFVTENFIVIKKDKYY